MLGGPLGAVLGAAMGHNFDRGLADMPKGRIFTQGDQERVQTAFFTATFSVMGRLAKADGHVTQDEIRLAQAVMDEMDLDSNMRKAAISLFNEGKSDGFPLEDVLAQFKQECHGRSTLIRVFIEIQLQAAYADAIMDRAERALLILICNRLGFSELEFRRLEQMVQAERHFGGGQATTPQGPSLEDAYALLGVSPNAQDAEVQRAYRRLMSQHHPDKLVSKGLPEEMMKIASQKTHEIKQAYDLIREHRGS